jgi:prepilin-type N-terminal cleavage/methylation domain-containing protein
MTNRLNPERGTRNPELVRAHAGDKGFTILELLVVIFIMLAMTGIAVAAFRQFLDTERIKLAGGQVVGAIRMARQYAMSKRTKVMVEFVSPDFGVLTTPPEELAPSDSGLAYARYPNNKYSGRIQVYLPSNYRRISFAKFNMPTIGANQSISRCTLKVKAANNWYHRPVTVTVKGVTNDTWTGGTLCYNNHTNYPADGGTIGDVSVQNLNTWYDLDATAFFAAQAKGDGIVSIRFETPQGDRGLYNMSTKIEFEIDTDTGETEESTGHLSRSVRIIPYIRQRNAITGGFSWLLDQDFNNLKTMQLPRNIHFVLSPARSSVDQYDPGDLVDKRSPTRKVWFNLWPDGTCTAVAPDVEGWANRLNTVILRDTVTGDLSLLFVPPASSFTRQRYLFGAEVEAFVAAHSLYSLW